MRSVLAAMLTLSLVGAADGQSADEPRYLEQTSRAMDKMMADMNVAPTGDVDADFVAGMTPHHRGAIDMAKAELQYGHNELLRRIAQGIIVAQLQEIEAMRLALATGSPGPEHAPVSPKLGMSMPQGAHHEP